MGHWDTMETGIFYSRRAADQATARVCELGYTLNDINLLMSEKTRAEEFADVTARKATEGAVAGALIGGGLSAVVASLAATGSIAAIAATGGAVTPLVAGPLAAALAALGAGGAGGGIIGALIGAGVSEGQAKKFEDALKKGGIVIGVQARTHEDRDRIKRILAEDQETRPPSAHGSAVDDTADFVETGATPNVRRY